MSISVVVHVVGEDAFRAEMDDLPDPSQTYVMFRNIRMRDGRPHLHVTDGAKAFLYPWTKITFIEVMDEVAEATAAGAANGAAGTTVLGFFREDDKRS